MKQARISQYMDVFTSGLVGAEMGTNCWWVRCQHPFWNYQAVVEWPLGNAKLSICPLCKCSLTCNKTWMAVVAETDQEAQTLWCVNRD